MFSALFDLLFANAAVRLGAEIKKQTEKVSRAARYLGIWLAFIQIALFFMVIGFGFWSAALFLVFAHLPRFELAAFWTGLVGIIVGLLFLGAAKNASGR